MKTTITLSADEVAKIIHEHFENRDKPIMVKAIEFLGTREGDMRESWSVFNGVKVEVAT